MLRTTFLKKAAAILVAFGATATAGSAHHKPGHDHGPPPKNPPTIPTVYPSTTLFPSETPPQ